MGLFGLGGKSGSGDDGKGTDDKNKLPKEDEGAAEDKKKGGDGAGGKGDDGKGADDKDKELDIEAIVQNAIAEATKGWKTEKESLEAKISELMKKGLIPEQLKELEEKEKAAAQNKREADLTERENRLYAITAIKKAGLDDGGETALEIIDLVMGKDEKEIDVKVKSLSELVKKMVAAEVDKTFRDNGRSPESGKGADGEEKKNDIAKRLGQRMAKSNEQARKVQYIKLRFTAAKIMLLKPVHYSELRQV